jgi:hypothetical protein
MAFYSELPRYFVKPLPMVQELQPVQVVHSFLQFPVQFGGFQASQNIHFVPTPINKEYDYALLLVLTKDQQGTLQLLLPVDNHNYINMCEQKIYHNDDPDMIIEKSMSFYGFNKYNINGKFTKIKHFEKTTNITYKIGILYIPYVSRSIINSCFQNTNGYSHRIERVNLMRNYKYYSNMHVSNIIFAILNMYHKLI